MPAQGSAARERHEKGSGFKRDRPKKIGQKETGAFRPWNAPVFGLAANTRVWVSPPTTLAA